MINTVFRADMAMIIAAVIWGSAFVVQKEAMDVMGPFLFTGIRFAMGVALIYAYVKIFKKGISIRSTWRSSSTQWKIEMGIVCLMIFLGVNLQQIGIIYTSAANAAFLTGIYNILVPLTVLFLGRIPKMPIWFGAVFALLGIYFISLNGLSNLGDMNFGDILCLICAIFWTVHIIMIERITQSAEPMVVAIIQGSVCAALSLAVGIPTESIQWDLFATAIPYLLWGGCLSIGIGYTIQVVAQKIAPPSHAAILLSSEALFAGLSETIYSAKIPGFKVLLGFTFMTIAVLVVQSTALTESVKKKMRRT